MKIGNSYLDNVSSKELSWSGWAVFSSKSKSPKSAVDDAVEPFRQDNSRLMMENNELHKSLVSLRQKINENKNEFKQQARRLQNENADLRQG